MDKITVQDSQANCKENRRISHINIDEYINYADFYARFVPDLKFNGSGKSENIKCPFPDHAGERTGSFGIADISRGFYKCFGCGKSGNAISFLVDLGICPDKKSAFQWLAAEYNIPVNGSASASLPKPEKPYFLSQWEKALSCLKKNGLPTDVHGYFRSRGFSDKMIPHLISKDLIGYLPKDLFSDKGQEPKEYRPSVIFPLYDSHLKIQAIQRIFFTTDGSKAKKKTLGSLKKSAFLCNPEPFKSGNPGRYTVHEGIFDAMAVFDATDGKMNAISVMSAAEAAKAKDYGGLPIAFFDNFITDKEGRHAYEIFQREMPSEMEIGIIGWHGIEAKDANEILQKGKRDVLIQMLKKNQLTRGEGKTDRKKEPAKADPAADTAATPEPIKIITFGELAEMKIEFIPLIDGLLGPKESLLVCGPSGIGKSLFINLVTLSCACPETIPNGLFDLFSVRRPLKSLIIQSENTMYSANLRLRNLLSARPELKAGMENIFIPQIKDDCRMSGDFEDDSFREKILEMLSATGADLLVIDPLISFHSRDENDNPGMRKALDKLTLLCDEADVGCIVMHHTGKNGSKNGTFSGRGASAIGDWSANTLILERFYPGNETYGPTPYMRIYHEKPRNFPQAEPFFLERTANLDLMRIEKPTAKDDRISEIILSALSRIGGEADSQGDLEKEIIQQENCSRSTSQNIIKAAMSRKIIMPIPGKGRKIGIRLYEK